jgi:hypothetical protein
VGAAVSAGLARDGGEGQLTDELLDVVAGWCGRAATAARGMLWEECHAQIKARVDGGLTVVKIGVLLERQGITVPYRACTGSAQSGASSGACRRIMNRISLRG